MGALASVEPREVQQVVDQVPETTAVTRELRLDRVARGTRRLISQEPLGGRLKRGDRRAEFVRGVGQERPHGRLRRARLRYGAIEKHECAGERRQERQRDHAADRLSDLQAADLPVDPGKAAGQRRGHVHPAHRDHLVHGQERRPRCGLEAPAGAAYPGEVHGDPLGRQGADHRLQRLRRARRPECARAGCEIGAEPLLEPVAVAHRDHDDERCESGDDREYRGDDQARPRGSVAAHAENR